MLNSSESKLSPRSKRHSSRAEAVEQVRQGDVAAVLQLGQGVLTVRRAGVAGHEDQRVFLRAVTAPFEEVLDVGGLAVLIGAEESEIEVVARVLEVVHVAAESPRPRPRP